MESSLASSRIKASRWWLNALQLRKLQSPKPFKKPWTMKTKLYKDQIQPTEAALMISVSAKSKLKSWWLKKRLWWKKAEEWILISLKWVRISPKIRQRTANHPSYNFYLSRKTMVIAICLNSSKKPFRLRNIKFTPRRQTSKVYLKINLDNLSKNTIFHRWVKILTMCWAKAILKTLMLRIMKWWIRGF